MFNDDGIIVAIIHNKVLGVFMPESFEEIALSTYQNNLLYFEESQKAIYSKLISFQSALDNGYYQSNYDLILQENYFDVLELATQNYLYAQNSDDYATLAAQSIDFDKKNNVYETFRKITIEEKDLQTYETMDIKTNNLSGLASILHYIRVNNNATNTLKSIQKFIFFGVGLGQHLITINNKINAKKYLIVEDDLELFKLSLFTTPYYELALKSELVFSVFDSKEEFTKIAVKFLEENFYYNHYKKYFQMLNHTDEKLEEFHIKIASQSHNLFFYDAILEQYLRPLEYIKDNYSFLNILHSYAASPLGLKPVLLLAAGPSLEKNIHWIQENQEKFIIVALSATLKSLAKHNISPTIVTHIDGFDDAVGHFNGLNSTKLFENTLFLLSARTPRAIISSIPKGNIFLFENGTSYKKALGNLSAPCIGSTTYLLLLAFGVKNLYLLGLDLALDGQTGATHSDGHFQAKELDLDSAATHKDTITFKDHIIETAGNLQDTVYTLPDWKLSIESVNASSVGFKKQNQNVYNLSDGAAFSNTIAQNIALLPTSSLEKLNKENISHEISRLFKQKSSSTTTNTETALLQKRLNYALSLKEIIEKQNKTTFDTADDFLDSLKNIFIQCAANTSDIAYDLSLVYQEYFRIINTFIFDFFNTDELQETKTHANNINQLLSKQLLRIVDAYIKELNFLR